MHRRHDGTTSLWSGRVRAAAEWFAVGMACLMRMVAGRERDANALLGTAEAQALGGMASQEKWPQWSHSSELGLWAVSDGCPNRASEWRDADALLWSRRAIEVNREHLDACGTRPNASNGCKSRSRVSRRAESRESSREPRARRESSEPHSQGLEPRARKRSEARARSQERGATGGVESQEP